MKWLDSLVSWLFPKILVEGTPWRDMWRDKERASFVSVIRAFLLLCALIYLAHYFFYDKPNNLEPIEAWFRFRVAMASLAISAFLYYMSPFVTRRYYRVPAVLYCWLVCYAQSYVALYHGRESWIFCYILIVACVLALRMSALNSTIFSAMVICSQIPVLLEASIPGSYIFTGSVIAIGMGVVARASYLFEVRSFLLDQENMASQKKIIELNIEFADRIRSFIPRIIAQRIDRYIESERMSVIEASVEVLSPKVKSIACLFSDIRGFTRESKDLEPFLLESVLPEVKACTDAIEDFSGIPRKIGDLIFAYFDGENPDRNLLASLGAAMSVSRLNQAMNATSNSKSIKRYVLLSYGQALVGNLGGLDSSIEITALGSPVNFLSRVDEITKMPAIAQRLQPGDIVLSEDFSRQLSVLLPGLKLEKVVLADLGLSIRDFADVRAVYILPVNDSNYETLLEALDVESAGIAAIGSSGKVAA